MKQDFNCNPQDIICCICPSIRKCHFEVDRDVKEIFKNEFKDLENINEIIETTINNTHITIFLLDFKIYLLSKLILDVDRRSTYASSSIYYFLKV